MCSVVGEVSLAPLGEVAVGAESLEAAAVSLAAEDRLVVSLGDVGEAGEFAVLGELGEFGELGEVATGLVTVVTAVTVVSEGVSVGGGSGSSAATVANKLIAISDISKTFRILFIFAFLS